MLANVVYATSYVATRVTLDAVPPAALALLRLVIGGLVLLVLVRGSGSGLVVSRPDRLRIAAMGVVGFAAAFALGHWGLERSTATNAALLIAVEPLTILLLGPVLLGDRLSRREGLGAAGALTGAFLVVVNGIPGVTERLVPHWHGDLLLVLAGVAYAAYTLLGRPVLARQPALPITTRSILWGAPALLPLVALEWAQGRRPVWTVPAALGVLYLAVVITALGYVAWNRALERVTAARAAIFLNLQPVVGALLGVGILGEPLTPYTVAGGMLVVAGLLLTVRAGAGERVYSKSCPNPASISCRTKPPTA